MNKIALITGATSGIGKATATKLAEIGYNLIITGRRGDRLTALEDELKAKGIKVLALQFDVRNQQEVHKEKPVMLPVMKESMLSHWQ